MLTLPTPLYYLVTDPKRPNEYRTQRTLLGKHIKDLNYQRMWTDEQVVERLNQILKETDTEEELIMEIYNYRTQLRGGGK